MLPTGHVAAGFLTAEVLLKIAKPDLPTGQIQQLLWWGVFFGFAPDLDVFYFFLKHKTLLVSPSNVGEDNHRKFWSHAPFYWLVAGLLIFLLSGSLYWKYVGLLLWLGSWSHFLLDSIEYGIPWLSPFSQKLFALKNQGIKLVISESNFFRHSLGFLKLYSKRLSFYLEVLIILSAIFVFLKY